MGKALKIGKRVMIDGSEGVVEDVTRDMFDGSRLYLVNVGGKVKAYPEEALGKEGEKGSRGEEK